MRSSKGVKDKLTKRSVLSILAITVLAAVSFSDYLLLEIPDLAGSVTRRVLNTVLDLPPPKELIYLMGYPHSGTEEILEIAESMSRTSMATNYGELVVTKDYVRHFETYKSESIQEEHYKTGPFKNNIDYPVHKDTVLVKTHCTGYCLGDKKDCHRIDYIRNSMSAIRWRHSCSKPRSFDPERKQHTMGEQRYLSNVIQKGIIAYRNPMQIVISRFKEYHEQTLGNGMAFDTAGLHDWCELIDVQRRRTKEIKRRINKDPLMLASGFHNKDIYTQVPCYTEFIRILKWYDNAIDLAEKKLKESLFQPYERLGVLKRTLDTLERFTGLRKEKNSQVVFTGTTEEYDLFTPEDKTQIKAFIEILGTNSKSYKKYFSSYFKKLWTWDLSEFATCMFKARPSIEKSELKKSSFTCLMIQFFKGGV